MGLQSYFLFAGEHSGDLHASALMKAMRKIEPEIRFCGVGGPLMEQEGLTSLFAFEELQLFGVAEIIKHFPKLWKRFYFVRDWILEHQPQVVVLIDYPGWNLRLSRSLRKAGYHGKIVHYIAPTVWAWGKGRIKQLERYVDLLLFIFPFEKEVFADAKLATQFIGHPLVDRIQEASKSYDPEWKKLAGIPPADTSLALFPGSRRSEIKRLFPRMLETIALIKEKNPNLQVMISCADPALAPLLQEQLTKAGLGQDANYCLVPSQYRYEMMQSANSALAKSGTVTLELALYRVPTAVVYDLSRFNYWIARYVMRLKLPYYCIVNILAGREIYPEWIEKPFIPTQVASALVELYQEGPIRQDAIDACQDIACELSDHEKQTTAERAARAIFQLSGQYV